MNRDTAGRARSGVFLVGLALLLSACAAGAASTPSATVATPTPGPTAAPSVVPAATPSGAPAPSPTPVPTATPAATQATDADNGRTVTVRVGSEVTVDLGSTYWQLGGSSDPAVLQLVAGPTTSAAPIGGCVPGGGCGTVTATFRALAPGSATIIASRTTCGEAMRCTGTAGAYELTVVVGG